MSNPQSRDRTGSRGAWLAAFSAIALAFTNIAAPVVYDAGSNPVSVLMLRALATVVLIGIVLLASARLQRLSRREEMNCIISGLLFMFAGFGLLNALAISPASVVVLVLYLFPLLTTVFDALINHRAPTKITVLLLLIALLGIALVLGTSAEGINMTGIMLAFLAAVSAAATLVWNNHKLSAVDPEQITFRMFCVSFVVFGSYLLVFKNFALPTSDVGLLVLAFMLACFAAAFIAMFRAVQMAGSVRAAMTMNLEPLVTVLLSVIILSEIINRQQAVGMALVLAAVLASQYFSRPSTVIE